MAAAGSQFSATTSSTTAAARFQQAAFAEVLMKPYEPRSSKKSQRGIPACLPPCGLRFLGRLLCQLRLWQAMGLLAEWMPGVDELFCG